MRKPFVAIASLTFAFAAAGQVVVSFMPREPIVDPQTSMASALVVLRNDAPVEANVLLVADDFIAEANKTAVGAKTVFAIADGTSPPKSELLIKVPAKGRQSVRMEVSKLGHAGIATATLMDHGTDLGIVAVARTQFPFNVAPVGWREDAPSVIRFEKGDGPLVYLKNEDLFDYRVTWILSAPGLKPKSSEETILVPAQSTRLVQIPVGDWLPKKGDLNALLKNLSSPGSLHLAATNAAGTREWKTRDLPVTIERSYWSAAQQTFRTFVLLALLVALGGIASIIVTHGIPNRLRRIKVREFIKSITPKMRALSTAVQSDLRTGIRVERTRLLQRLRSRSTISPDFAVLAKECETTAQLLNQEIDILDRIDLNMRRIETKWPTAGAYGPTLLKGACGLLADAQLALDRPEISDEVVNAAGALVQKAEATIDNASTLDEPSKKSVKERLNRLAVEREQFKDCKVTQRIIEEVPGLATAVEMKADELTETNFADYDNRSTKLDYVFRFAALCEKATAGTEKDKCIAQFIGALRRGGFVDFQTAEGLAQQMREIVFTQHVANEIRKGRYSIAVEPQGPKVNQPVSFTIVFDDPNVNAAAARHAIAYTWSFHHAPAPEESLRIVRIGRWIRDAALKVARRRVSTAHWQTWTERGLAVSHYFPTSGTFDVTAHFKDDEGDEVKSATDISKPIDVTGERLGLFGERTKIEYSRLAIVLIITVAGLLVGARDELAKLDLIPGLIAVFMLGFTADQIKNILAPPASQ